MLASSTPRARPDAGRRALAVRTRRVTLYRRAVTRNPVLSMPPTSTPSAGAARHRSTPAPDPSAARLHARRDRCVCARRRQHRHDRVGRARRRRSGVRFRPAVYDAALAEARRTAVCDSLALGGVDAVLELADDSKLPRVVGVVTADVGTGDLCKQVLLSLQADGHRREFAMGWVARTSELRGPAGSWPRASTGSRQGSGRPAPSGRSSRLSAEPGSPEPPNPGCVARWMSSFGCVGFRRGEAGHDPGR